jgi:hypothetical protein
LQVPPIEYRQRREGDPVPDQDPMDDSERPHKNRHGWKGEVVAIWVLAPITAWALVYFLVSMLGH